MKIVITSILFFFLSLYSMAQLAPIGTKWTYTHTEYFESDHTTRILLEGRQTIIRDTIIDSIVYSKFDKPTDLLIAKEGTRLFYYSKNKRDLLFDFNVKVGDTLRIDYYPLPSNNKYIDTIIQNYPVIIKGIIYRYNADKNDSIKTIVFGNDSIYNAEISERIISSTFQTGRSIACKMSNLYAPIFEYGVELACYEEPSGFTLSGFMSNNDCNKLSVQENTLNKEIEINPNPAKDILHINWNYAIKENTILYLYNNQAQELYKGTLPKENTLNLNDLHLKAGLYWVLINDGTSSFYKKVIIE